MVESGGETVGIYGCDFKSGMAEVGGVVEEGGVVREFLGEEFVDVFLVERDFLGKGLEESHVVFRLFLLR